MKSGASNIPYMFLFKYTSMLQNNGFQKENTFKLVNFR